MSKTMAEVLAEHYIDITQTSPDQIGYCVCGYTAHPMNVSWDEHLAEVLSAAGFGLVADAKAEALLTMADRLEKARDMTWNGSMRKVNGWASAADFIRQHAEQADPS